MTFNRADILLPTDKINKTAWSVVACDQYTSEPEYWENVKSMIGESPSAYNLILPEVYLGKDGENDKIKNINNNMIEYVKNGIFDKYKNTYIYIERTLRNGKIRKGIIGAIDLEDYDYSKGSKSAVRATEGTVAERIPPRLKVRLNAKLELPHVMVLIDDAKKSIIENIANNKDSFKMVYSFDLMMNSGSIEGWIIDEDNCNYLENKLIELSDISLFNSKYAVNEEKPLVFAVGDGNHSLATAKEYYNTMKEKFGDEAINSPARYALCELVNLHDESLEFEAIHRVIFDVDTDDIQSKLSAICNKGKMVGKQNFKLVNSKGCFEYYFKNPTANLTVGTMQSFLDDYLEKNGGHIDYIHGDKVVYDLSKEKSSCGIILEAMKKEELYKTVILDGALPRKTFSMGEACDKRFYTETRVINEKL